MPACGHGEQASSFQLGRFYEAETALRAAIKIDPDYESPHLYLPIVLLFQGQFDLAKSEYERLKSEPFDPPRYPTYADAFSFAFEQYHKRGWFPEECDVEVAEMQRFLLE